MAGEKVEEISAIDPKTAFCASLPLILYALDQIQKPWAILAASTLRRVSVSVCGGPALFGDGQQADPTADELEDSAIFAEAIKTKCDGGNCC